MRGAHRGVWCSKGQRLMEAKLFAAESKRPAQNGRALSAQRKVWVVKRGQETIGVLSPFALAGGHRRLRRRAAAMPGLPIGSQSRLQRRTAVSAEINPLLRVKKKERRMACRPQTVKRKTHRLSPVRSGVTQTPFESGSYRPPCRRRWRAGCCASRRAALRSARCTAARERRVCRSPSRHS